ncbi:TlpA family protein disulfide reductase [Sphingobacterium sp. UDSM-2020]|uniref:TlpA family protein disulfide reductase n=1 Tax=Sphingobacterium sp. UDSM-2020 TaxID=2795738 RepID=UPI001935ED4A|nr:hypothetical protein [Sphingobacterium sp. UDSM-2020]QQD13137.1 hypothetical protein JAZ75_21485 [Sphingobacterium sp. UDSM-2020]
MENNRNNKIGVFIVLICFSNLFAFGQSLGMKIGEQYNYKEILQSINYKKGQFAIKDFEDKLIILDFFTTNCGSCIAAMPKNNELQRVFNEKIQILPVTTEKRNIVQSFFSKNDFVKDNKLPVIYEDVALSKLFPYKGVPHIVWIYKGVVKAVTAGDMLTGKNIREILEGKDIRSWPLKDDYYQYVEDKNNRSESTIYSALSPYKEGAKLKYSIDTLESEGLIKYKMTNVTAIPAFLYALSKMRTLPLMKKERIVIELNNKGDYQVPDSVPQAIWTQRHAFCYESTWPLEMEEHEIMNRIMRDLNNKLGLNVRLEDRVTPVWLVSNGKDKVESSGMDQKNQLEEIGTWTMLLEISNPTFPPIVLKGVEKSHLVDTDKVSDFKTFQAVITKNGLVATEQEFPVECLVISNDSLKGD